MGSAPDLYGVIGHPVAHSRSPLIHRLFATRTGERMDYVLLDAAPGEFAAVVAEFHNGGGKGLNVTVPYKQEAYGIATRRTERARLAGAVNTLAWLDGDLLGDNTDGAGLVRDLQVNLGIGLEGSSILLLGAGGASRGVVGPLLDCGARRVVIANRTHERADALAARFGMSPRLGSMPLENLTSNFDLVVNATSASLYGEVPQIPRTAIGPGTFCYDMMYGREPTVFLRWAEANGAGGWADGLGMLVEQAAESFLVWRGVRPDTGPVLAEVRRSLS
jgi:shikimate dehydrogenase